MPEAMPKSCRITTSVKAIDPKPITVVSAVKKNAMPSFFAYADKTASLGDSPFEVASRNSATMWVSSVAPMTIMIAGTIAVRGFIGTPKSFMNPSVQQILIAALIRGIVAP